MARIRLAWGSVAVASMVGAAMACPPKPVDTTEQDLRSTLEQIDAATPQPKPAAPKAATSSNPAKARVELERELNKLRATYFGSIRNTEIRQVGLIKLRAYIDDSVNYPTIMKVFEREQLDVRSAILDMLAEQKSDEADATIAFSAVYDKDRKFREVAAERLAARYGSQDPCMMVKRVIAAGLKGGERTAGAAANLAGVLKLYEAIPAIIAAQVTGAGGVDVPLSGPPGAIGQIVVGTQQAYVADLTPVVGDSAVGFDPTLGVVTDGTVMRVFGASVVTYRTEVHTALVALANSGWDGRSTESLGWDNDKWRAWYAEEFKPYREKVEAEKASASVAKP